MNRNSSNSVAVNEMSSPRAGHFVAVLVEHQVADDDLGAAGLAGHPGAAQQRAQPQHHLFEAERLGDVVVAARGQARRCGPRRSPSRSAAAAAARESARAACAGHPARSCPAASRRAPPRRAGSARASAMAVAPSPAVAISQPSYRRAIDTSSASTGSSSTTSTWMGLPSARRITMRAGSCSLTAEPLGPTTRPLFAGAMGADCAFSMCQL